MTTWININGGCFCVVEIKEFLITAAFDDDKILEFHLVITLKDGNYKVIDLGSSQNNKYTKEFCKYIFPGIFTSMLNGEENKVILSHNISFEFMRGLRDHIIFMECQGDKS